MKSVRYALGLVAVTAPVMVLALGATSSDGATATARGGGLAASFGFADGGERLRDGSGRRTATTARAVSAVKGRFGSGLAFRGPKAHLTVRTRPAVAVERGITFEAWVRPTTTSGRRAVLAKVGAGSRTVVGLSLSRGAATAEARVGGRRVVLRGGATVRRGRWTHLALTYDGSVLRLLQDGRVTRASVVRGEIADSSGPVRVGGAVRSLTSFRGVIDEVRVYRRALSPSGIRRDMRSAVGSAGALGGAAPAPATGPAAPTAPAPAAPPASQPGPSGVPIPAGQQPSGWREIFSDDFSTDVREGGWTGCNRNTRRCSGLPAAVRDKWYSYPEGYTDTSGNGKYIPSEVNSISNSMLRLRMRNEGGVTKVAAPIPLLSGPGTINGGLRYGRYAVRFKADPTPGYKVAWLLWPHSDVTPRDGEIDFPEGDLDGEISAFMHRQNGTSGSDQDAYVTRSLFASGWHTAVMEWGPDEMVFILDGNVIGRSTSRIPNTPMDYVMQSETVLSGAPPAPGSVANVYVNWVVISARS